MYNLGKYRYKNFAIYKQVWWFVYKLVDPGPYSYLQGIRKVNSLCGIEEEEPDYSKFEVVTVDNRSTGRYLVNFKKPEGHFRNDPLPACINPHKELLLVTWDNSFTSVSDCSQLNVFALT